MPSGDSFFSLSLFLFFFCIRISLERRSHQVLRYRVCFYGFTGFFSVTGFFFSTEIELWTLPSFTGFLPSFPSDVIGFYPMTWFYRVLLGLTWWKNSNLIEPPRDFLLISRIPFLFVVVVVVVVVVAPTPATSPSNKISKFIFFVISFFLSFSADVDFFSLFYVFIHR